MNRSQISLGGMAVGAGVLVTCMCAATSLTLGGLALAGGAAPFSLHAALVIAAAALIVGGLAGRSARAAGRALLGFALFGIGYALAPPPVSLPEGGHGAMHLAGFGFTLFGIGGIVWGFLTAFPTRRPGAAACAAGGVGAAAGCSCCASAGALYWLAVAVGVGPISGVVLREYAPHFLFLGIAALALHRLGGWRLALVAFVSGGLAFTSPRLLRLLFGWDISPIPGRITEIAGVMVLMWAIFRSFAAARRPVAVGDPLPAAGPPAELAAR